MIGTGSMPMLFGIVYIINTIHYIKRKMAYHLIGAALFMIDPVKVAVGDRPIFTVCDMKVNLATAVQIKPLLLQGVIFNRHFGILN